MKAIETINEKTAQAAWNANHFGDYRTGSCTAEYAAMVTEARKIAESQKKKVPEKYHKKIDNLLAYYERKLAANINQRNSIDASYPSILICGGGGFDNRKKAKQNARRDSNMQEYTYIASILQKIKTVGTGGIMSGDADALDQLRDKLEKLEARQEHMKRINAYYRKYKTLDGCPDISEAGAKTINEHMQRFGYNKPCPTYELSNNSANIRRIRDRIETIEREKNRTAEAITGDGWQLIEKPEIMRIQFIFDDKPDSDTRATLKRNGFRWAPSEGAWQRTLNNAGRYAAKDVMKQLPQAEPAEVPTVEEPQEAPAVVAENQAPTVTAEPAANYELVSYSKNNIDANYIDSLSQSTATTPTPAEAPTPAEPAPEEITAAPEEPAKPAPVTVPEEIKRFEIGKTYQTRSICNNDCIISITVTARTDKTITVIERDETKRLRINEKSTEYHKAETVYPWGHYSMAPQIHADQIADPDSPAPDPEPPAPDPEPPAPDPDDSTNDPTPDPAPERPKAKRRAAAPWVGKTMTAYPKKAKKTEWLGRKMVITIGERSARPAGA